MSSCESILCAVEAALAGEPGIKVVIVYGSASSGKMRPGSDVDVAVLFGRQLDMEAHLERRVGVPPSGGSWVGALAPSPPGKDAFVQHRCSSITSSCHAGSSSSSSSYSIPEDEDEDERQLGHSAAVTPSFIRGAAARPACH